MVARKDQLRQCFTLYRESVRNLDRYLEIKVGSGCEEREKLKHEFSGYYAQFKANLECINKFRVAAGDEVSTISSIKYPVYDMSYRHVPVAPMTADEKCTEFLSDPNNTVGVHVETNEVCDSGEHDTAQVDLAANLSPKAFLSLHIIALIW